jgi:hypothetical protein
MNDKENITRFEIERRFIFERRTDNTRSTFPIRLHCGAVIARDRRSIPERRVQKIIVSEQRINMDEFNKLFKKYSQT